ncbi:hypothetical protein E3O18_06850 [Cryobacterium sp. TMT2-42-4]|nr:MULTISPECIES: hypothetical protein [unclassified Cryobacterium]TFC25742.1 hypothetical protein E3O22_14375 [Cryobacterium sp. TMT2-18-2]TFC36718.1 hypothetical protein E3O18_06850 [Cryobacterium sp. TMT2-42-4]
MPVKKSGNGLGLAALIVGLVALLFAFIPAISLVAGFIGFVGLVLGVIAIFRKGRSRGVAISGTAVSLISIIVAIIMSIVYAAAFITAVDDAIQSESSVTEPGVAAADDAAEPVEAGDVGTRANPAPVGSTVTIEEFGTPTWEVTLGAATLNATDQVKAANEFNPDPEPGNAYAIVPATVKYIGAESGNPNFSLDFTYVSSDGRSYDGGFVSMDGQLSDVADLYTDATATANVIIEVPATGPEAGLWGVSYIGGDPVFLAVQ